MKPIRHCDKCSKTFKSLKWLKNHKAKQHSAPPPPAQRPRVAPPPPPLPAPKKIVTRAVNDLPEELRLEGGGQLDVGDVFWHIRKFVIKRISKTAGDNTVEVEAECTKRSWQKDFYGI